jgi:hypothetical protein
MLRVIILRGEVNGYEYASISQSLDRSFLARALKQNSSNELTNNEFRNQLTELEKSRNR